MLFLGSQVAQKDLLTSFCANSHDSYHLVIVLPETGASAIPVNLISILHRPPYYAIVLLHPPPSSTFATDNRHTRTLKAKRQKREGREQAFRFFRLR